jgi:hypothetical protein
MAREGLPCTWRKRYPHLKTNACAVERQRTFQSFCREQERALREMFESRHW